MALDVKDAFKLEKLEDYINTKTEELNHYLEEYEFFLRKLNTFVSDYNNKVKEFSNIMNQKIDDMHQAINSFDTIYNQSLTDLDKDSNNVLTLDESYKGELSNDIINNLDKKLNESIDNIKLSAEGIMNKYLEDFKEAQEMINKINQRLNKLKSREFDK